PFRIRGGTDYLAMGPTGKFVYAVGLIDKTVSVCSIAADGALSFTGSSVRTGNSPLSIAVTPFVVFTSSFAELQVTRKTFDLTEYFSLGANSRGINPQIENVTLQIGTFSTMIPAGSFKLTLDGSFAFSGDINGVGLDLRIVPLSGYHSFKLEGGGSGNLDFSGLTNPVSVVLTIGTNIGSTPVIVRF
ncbi:MAG: hypothetical protein WAK31_21700, partial [Chthoniobacterales bacterium]